MPKVKIIWCQHFDSYDDYHEIARWIPPGEFEEISDADLERLHRHLPRLRGGRDAYPHIVRLDAEPVASRVAEVLEQARLVEEALAAQKKRRDAAAAKRKASRRADRKAQYEALKKEFDDGRSS